MVMRESATGDGEDSGRGDGNICDYTIIVYCSPVLNIFFHSRSSANVAINIFSCFNKTSKEPQIDR